MFLPPIGGGQIKFIESAVKSREFFGDVWKARNEKKISPSLDLQLLTCCEDFLKCKTSKTNIMNNEWRTFSMKFHQDLTTRYSFIL